MAQQRILVTDASNSAEGLKLGRLDQFIGFRLRRIQNQLSRRYAAATAGLGLRSGLFSALAIIEANPGLSQSELSHEIGQDKSVTVTFVDDLEASGWAVRERSKVDRRRHALFITPAGTQRLQQLSTILAGTEACVLGQLSPAEFHLMGEMLDRMYAASVDDE